MTPVATAPNPKTMASASRPPVTSRTMQATPSMIDAAACRNIDMRSWRARALSPDSIGADSSGIPLADDMLLMLESEGREASRIQGEQAPRLGVKAQPCGRQDSQDVSVGDQDHI